MLTVCAKALVSLWISDVQKFVILKNPLSLLSELTTVAAIITYVLKLHYYISQSFSSQQ